MIKYCEHSCDQDRRMLAREIARRIFVRNFKPDTSDINVLAKVLSRIVSLVRSELNDEPFSRELLLCVKLHLWRRIKYGTKIPIRDIQVENSLKKL